MPLTLESSRFGRIEIDPETVVEFPDGLIGLGGVRFALLATSAESDFSWLHSLEDPELALPVANPHQFFDDFSVELDEIDAARCGLQDAESVDVYVTVCASRELSEFTANLKGPILIHNGQGHQVINQAPEASTRARLFPEDRAPSDPSC